MARALDPEVVALLLGRRRREDPLEGLTAREREVLGLMAEGRSNAAIAEALVVTERAVEKHVTSIFSKLDLAPTVEDHRRVLAVLAYLRACVGRAHPTIPYVPAAPWGGAQPACWGHEHRLDGGPAPHLRRGRDRGARARRRHARLPAAQFTAIMGPSGSGKSTLMHLLAGLDRPTSGSVVIDGQELSTLDDKGLTQLRRDRLGFVFQAFNLVPVLTAEENITLPLTLAGRKPDQAWLDQLIDTVGLRDRLTHRPSELSGGQQQRVAVARALVHRPAVLFADEPTGNLDSHSSEEVLRLLRQAVDEFDQTVIMVTHDATAAAVADRIVVLSDGKVVHDGGSQTTEGVLDLMKAVA